MLRKVRQMPKRHPAILLVLLLFLLFADVNAARPPIPDHKLGEEESRKRRQQLILGLDGGSSSAWSAASELALFGRADQRTWRALIKAMSPPNRRGPLAFP